MKTEYKQVNITKEWIEQNVSPISWQRKIYPARVNTFVNHIRNNTFRPHSLITVTETEDGKYNVIDGQHKLEAVKRTGANILFDFRILKNIDEEEQMQEYETAADVKHHRNIDIIKLYIYGKNHEWLGAFLEEKHFPINISLNGGPNSLRIDNLLNVIYNGTTPFITRVSLNKRNIRRFLESIDSEVYSTVKEFCSLYKKCFGEPSKDNWPYKNMVMYTLMRIWLANKEYFKEEDFIKVFRQIESSAEIRQETYSMGLTHIREITRKIYRLINKGRSANMFIIFWNEELLI